MGREIVGRLVIGAGVVGGLHAFVDHIVPIETPISQIEQRISGGLEVDDETIESQHLDRLGDELMALGGVRIPLDITHAAEFDVGLGRVSLVVMRAYPAGRRPCRVDRAVEGVIAPFDQLDGITAVQLTARGQPPSRVQSAGTRSEDLVSGHRSLLRAMRG